MRRSRKKALSRSRRSTKTVSRSWNKARIMCMGISRSRTKKRSRSRARNRAEPRAGAVEEELKETEAKEAAGARSRTGG